MSRPILPHINTCMCKWTKFFVSLIKQFTSNGYTVKDSYDFTKDITEQNSKLHMTSLDVDCLFGKVPLNETINIYV